MTFPISRSYSEAFLRYDGGLMTDPNELRRPLADLMQAIEAQDTDQASTKIRQIIADLDTALPSPDPLGREMRPTTVRFSGLCHALLRDLRTAEPHIAQGNWPAAAKIVRETVLLLPEPHTYARHAKPN